VDGETSVENVRSHLVRVLFVGAGPAGLAPLVFAARTGTLTKLAAQGLAVVDREAEFGAGALRDHAIGSDTLAETFLECLADGHEPRLSALRQHETVVRLAAFAGGAAPLPLVAQFLGILGKTMREILVSSGAIVLSSHEARQSRLLPDENWCTQVVGPDGEVREIISERLVLATGAEQRPGDLDGACIGGRPMFPDLSAKTILSGEVLAHGGAALVAGRLAGRVDPKVVIIGGSHSALASANLILRRETGINFSEGGVTLLHRRPLRVFYPTVADALAEGYSDFTADDVCPVSQRLYRLAGFRLDARELTRRILGIGGAMPEPRVSVCRLNSAGAEADAWRLLSEADLIVAAMGYRPRGLRLLDSDGTAIELAAHSSRGAPLVDDECRVLDQLQNPIPGVFALGLAAGFVPKGNLGGEPSFTGQTNGLWLWQNAIGALVMRGCRPERSMVPRRKSPRLRIALIVGTRPEAIKLAPLALAMRHSSGITPSIWCTGQHAQWAPMTLGYFGLTPDRTIESTETGHGLSRLGGSLLMGLDAAIHAADPNVLVVQGDTSSAFTGALAAAYAGLPLVHVEAGLRSGDNREPFPEEAHRRAIAQFTSLHCAPTEMAAGNLRAEGFSAQDILMCGNTVVDALQYVRRAAPAKLAGLVRRHPERPLVVVTCHRRENWGATFIGVCLALRQISQRDDCEIVFVLHPNPALADVARNLLRGLSNMHLMAPLGYPEFVQLLIEASLILTDSGGIQEEATSLGTPLLILRDKTERPEALRTTHARIIGSRQESIVEAVGALLANPVDLAATHVPSNVFGDGHASDRIVEAITARWRGTDRRRGAQISEAAADLGSNRPVFT
jgi:UDP-N-acetylglucosamine 2-epimerase (non-hydrolysing)